MAHLRGRAPLASCSRPAHGPNGPLYKVATNWHNGATWRERGGAPMEHVGVKRLKDALSAYLDRVAHGESIIVTDRGRPLARIVPFEPRLAPALEAALAEGRASWSGGKPTLPTNPPRVGGRQTVADLVAEERR